MIYLVKPASNVRAPFDSASWTPRLRRPRCSPPSSRRERGGPLCRAIDPGAGQERHELATNSPAIAWTPTGTATNSRGNVWLRSRLPLILCACDILSVAAFDRNRVRIDAATPLDTDREILSSIAKSANAPIASVCKRTVAAQASSRDTPRLGRKWRRSWTCSWTRSCPSSRA